MAVSLILVGPDNLTYLLYGLDGRAEQRESAADAGPNLIVVCLCDTRFVKHSLLERHYFKCGVQSAGLCQKGVVGQMQS